MPKVKVAQLHLRAPAQLVVQMQIRSTGLHATKKGNLHLTRNSFQPSLPPKIDQTTPSPSSWITEPPKNVHDKSNASEILTAIMKGIANSPNKGICEHLWKFGHDYPREDLPELEENMQDEMRSRVQKSGAATPLVPEATQATMTRRKNRRGTNNNYDGHISGLRFGFWGVLIETGTMGN